MASQFVEVVLNCASWQEAQAIADSLLEKHLVACVEFVEISSRFHWQGKITAANEVKLIMETIAGNFEPLDKVVSRLHSYDTYVLAQIPVDRISVAAAKWLARETSVTELLK